MRRDDRGLRWARILSDSYSRRCVRAQAEVRRPHPRSHGRLQLGSGAPCAALRCSHYRRDPFVGRGSDRLHRLDGPCYLGSGGGLPPKRVAPWLLWPSSPARSMGRLVCHPAGGIKVWAGGGAARVKSCCVVAPLRARPLSARVLDHAPLALRMSHVLSVPSHTTHGTTPPFFTPRVDFQRRSLQFLCEQRTRAA